MPIQDQVINELVKEQTEYFLTNASMEKKIDVKKRIEKRQKQLMKKKEV